MIFHTILFIIQIRELALSDITSCGESNMAASAKKFDIRAMIGEVEAYIVYAGPAPAAARSSLGAHNGSFIIQWKDRILPTQICAVSYGDKSSQNIAATWALAVVLGIVHKNDLPHVRVFMNCSYAIKIFEGVNKPKKYREVWQYILTDLFSAVRNGKHYRSFDLVHGTPDANMEGALCQVLLTGLMDTATPIIDSADACQKVIDQMDPISPVMLRALAEDSPLDVGLLSPEATAGVKWLGKDQTPHQTRPASTGTTPIKNIFTSPPRPSAPAKDASCPSAAPQTGEPLVTLPRSAASSPVIGLKAPSATLDAGIPPDASSQRSFWEASPSGASSPSIHLHLESTLPSGGEIQVETLSSPADVVIMPESHDEQCTMEEILDLTELTTTDSSNPFSDTDNAQACPTHIKANSSVRKACHYLSAAFATLPPAPPLLGEQDSLHRSSSLNIQPTCGDLPGGPAAMGGKIPPSSLSLPASPIRIDGSASPQTSCHPNSTQSSILQDAQRPFSRSDDDASLQSIPSLPDTTRSDLQEAMDSVRRAPRASISTEEMAHFTDSLFESVHPTMIEHLSDPFLAMLENVNTVQTLATSEIIERVEDSQQASAETVIEAATAQALGQEANVALLEKSINHESSLLHDDISHLKILAQTIHRFQVDLAATLSPSSRILTQLQRMASSLDDRQTSYVKTLEYYMYRIGVQFEESPFLQDRLRKMSGATPPPPSAPNKRPPRTISDREHIIKLKSDLITQEQELRLQICSVSHLEAAVNELEENAVIANRRINSLHSELII